MFKLLCAAGAFLIIAGACEANGPAATPDVEATDGRVQLTLTATVPEYVPVLTDFLASIASGQGFAASTADSEDFVPYAYVYLVAQAIAHTKPSQDTFRAFVNMNSIRYAKPGLNKIALDQMQVLVKWADGGDVPEWVMPVIAPKSTEDSLAVCRVALLSAHEVYGLWSGGGPSPQVCPRYFTEYEAAAAQEPYVTWIARRAGVLDHVR